MATSGSTSVCVSKSGYTLDYLVLSWKRNSYSSVNATNNITVELKIYSTASSGAQPWNLNGNTTRLRVGGDSAAYNKVNDTNSSIDFRGTSSSKPTTIATWTGDVQANNDGTCSVGLYGYINYADNSSSHMAGGGHNISLTATIDQIPRASVPTVSGTRQFGSTVTINTNRASSSFTHTIKCQIGSYSQTLTSVGASTSFTIPTSWAAAIPTATSATMTVTCTTYSGSSKIGSDQTASVTVSIPSSWKPSITTSKTVTRPDGSGNIIESVSTVTLTASATASTGTSINSYSWSGTGLSSAVASASATTAIITASSCSWTVTVTDKRGRSNTATVTATPVSGVSSFTCGNVNFGASHTVTITRKNSSITHTVKREIGSNYNNQTSVATSNSYTIPTSWASNASTTTSVSMTVTVTSYYGNTNLGSASKTVTVNVPDTDAWKPIIGSISASGNNTHNSKILRNRSTITITISDLTVPPGATVSYKFVGNALNTTTTGSSATSGELTSSGDLTYTVTATDSRGRTATKTVTVTGVVAYSKPTLSLTAHRCLSDSTADDNGEYCDATLKGTYYSSLSGNSYTMNLKYRVAGSSGSYTTLSNASSLEYTYHFAADTQYAYELVATITDSVGSSVTKKMTLSTAKTLIGFYKDKLMTVGTPATASLYSALGSPDFASVFAGETWLEGPLRARAAGAYSRGVYIIPYLTPTILGSSGFQDTYQKLLAWICTNYPNISHGTWIGEILSTSADNVSIHIFDTSVVDANGAPQYATVHVTRYDGTFYVLGYRDYVWYVNQFRSGTIEVANGGTGATTADDALSALTSGTITGAKHGSSTTSFAAAGGETTTTGPLHTADTVHANISTYINKFSSITNGSIFGVLVQGNTNYHAIIIFSYNVRWIYKCTYRNGTYSVSGIYTSEF